VDVLAIVMSGLALLISGGGTYLADRRARASGRLAQRALDDGREASTRALWSDAIEAVHRVLIDPTAEPIGDRLQTLRIRLTFLVDGLPDWTALDRWLAAEHHLGVTLGREVMEKARPGASIDEQLSLLRLHQDWGMAFAQNLRHARNIGYSPDDLDELRAHAWAVIKGVYRRNGWEEPPAEPARAT